MNTNLEPKLREQRLWANEQNLTIEDFERVEQ